MMYIRIFTFSAILLMLLGLTGIPSNNFAIPLSLIVPIIVYLFAAKFKLFPDKLLLNYQSILYFIWLIKEILLSSLEVIRIIWSRELPIESIFKWIDSKQNNDTNLVLYANSITLTPGTVTLDVSDNMLLVHALTQSSIDSLESANITMSNRIQQL